MKALWGRIKLRLTARRPYSPVDLPPPPASYQALATGLTAAAVFVLLWSLAGFWATAPGFLRLLAISVTAAGFGWLAWRSPIVAWGTSAVVLLTWGLLFRYTAWAHDWGHAVGQGLQGIITQIRVGHWQLQFDREFGVLLLILCGLILATLFVRESLGYGRGMLTLVVGTLVLLSEWLQLFDPAAVHLSFFMPAALALWAVGTLAYRNTTWSKAGRTVRYTANVLPAMGLVAVVLVGMLFGPHNINPIDLGKAGATLQKAIPTWLQKRGPGIGTSRFGLRYTGFSRDGLLGGPATPDNHTALTVRLNGTPDGTFYLRGMVADRYTGSAWELSKSETVANLKQGATMASGYSSAVPNQFLTMEITPADLFTPNLFAPLEPVSLTQSPDVTYTATGELLTSIVVRKPYVMSVRIPKYNGEQIRTLGTVNGRIIPEAADTTAGKQFLQYTQLPKQLPDRVRKLAEDITRKAGNSYEAAVLVEDWLRSHYPYTLDAPDLPAGRDFVDFFLFDAQTGYCTSFASSMTTMLRTLGIPARWVEGYALPAGLGKAQPDGSVLYEAQNTFAHAWVEALFPGYGWVTFDPTPRADIPPVLRNVPLPKVDTTTQTSDSTSANNIDDAATRNQHLKDLQPEDPGQSGAVASSAAKPWKQVGIPVGAALVLLIAGWWWLNRRHPGRRRPGTTAPVQVHWERFMRLMALFGYERAPGTTALEYAQELAGMWPTLADAIQSVARDYTSASYGPPTRALPSESNARAAELLTQACLALQERYGGFTYLTYPLRPRWSRIRQKPVPLPAAAD